MAEEQSKGIQQIEGCEVIYDMGSGLVIAKVPLDKVKEQDINARIMKNEMQDQLTAKHAAGGRVGGGPQLSWLAEEGWDEFVIPTNPSRRTRALELYEQAGEALGVSKHAEGGRIEGSNLSDMVSDHNLFTEATRNASYGYNETTEGNYEDNSAETFRHLVF